MRIAFAVIAKLLGIFWTAYAVANLLSLGLVLLDPARPTDRLPADVAYRLVSCIALLVQLALAVSLMLGTNNWATLLGIPPDLLEPSPIGLDALDVGTRLIGVYYFVHAVPEIVLQSLILLSPATAPDGTGPDILPLIQPGVTLLLAYLCAAHTSSVLRFVAPTLGNERYD